MLIVEDGKEYAVALRKESVDRNTPHFSHWEKIAIVALRKESVDRNAHQAVKGVGGLKSLSARRAWIEIS